MSLLHNSLAHRRARLAILLACIAYGCYSSGDAILKHLGPSIPMGTIMFFNGTFIVLMSLFFLAKKRALSAIHTTPRIKLHLARSFVVGSLVVLAISSLRLIPLPDFYGILFMAPFVTGVLVHFLFHEEIGVHRIIAMVIGFIGVLVLAGPTFENPNWGYFYTFIMLFLSSSHVLLVRKIGADDPWPLLTLFPGLGIMTIGAVLFAQNPVLPPLHTLPIMFVYASCIFGGQIAFSKAFTTTPLTAILAPYMYTQMLWGVAYSYLLFNQFPTHTTLIGAGIIIAAGIGNILYEQHLRRRHLLGARAARLKAQQS